MINSLFDTPGLSVEKQKFTQIYGFLKENASLSTLNTSNYANKLNDLINMLKQSGVD